MSIKIVKDYYIKQKAELMNNFSKNKSRIHKLLTGKFDDVKIDKILKQMDEEFESLIPKIPYIGGAENPFTENLISSTSDLAICRILENEGYSIQEIGEFFLKKTDDELRLEKESMEKSGMDPAQYNFDSTTIEFLKRSCERSKLRNYPGDWVADFVEGDGISFDHGTNVLECGIFKLFKELGAEKYVFLQCMRPMRQASIFGYGLFRTQTLPIGAPSCEYRSMKKLKAPQKITEEEVTYLREKKICLVCKGNIEGFDIYLCPNCEALYCEHCARTLIDLENTCWVCESPFDKSKPSKPFKRKEYEITMKKGSQKKK